MGHSYSSSEVNRTIHIARSPNHFTTELPSLLQVQWYPTCLLELIWLSRRSIFAIRPTLSRFHGLFNDHRRPNYHQFWRTNTDFNVLIQRTDYLYKDTIKSLIIQIIFFVVCSGFEPLSPFWGASSQFHFWTCGLNKSNSARRTDQSL